MHVPNDDRFVRLVVDSSSGTTRELVAASTGKKIRVWRMLLTTASGTTWQFKGDTTALTGPMTLSSLTLDYSQAIDRLRPWLETVAGAALNIVLGAAVQLSGFIEYTQE